MRTRASSSFTNPLPLSGEHTTASMLGQQHVPARPMPLHDPYGELSLAEIVGLVRSCLPTTHEHQTQDPEAYIPMPPPPHQTKSWPQVILTLIRLIFLWFQMLLPSIYFLRVSTIIKQSRISVTEYSQLAKGIMAVGMLGIPIIHQPPPASVRQFGKKWKKFVEQCMKEWKNLNIVSALLLRWVSSNLN